MSLDNIMFKEIVTTKMPIDARVLMLVFLALGDTYNIPYSGLKAMTSLNNENLRKALNELIRIGLFQPTNIQITRGEINQPSIFVFNKEKVEQNLLTGTINALLDLAVGKSGHFDRNGKVCYAPDMSLGFCNKERIVYDYHAGDKHIYYIAFGIKVNKQNLDGLLDGFTKQECEAIEKFFRYRKEQERELSISTQKAIANKAKTLKSMGMDIEAIVERSIENSWKGLFELPKGYTKSIKESQGIKGEIINSLTVRGRLSSGEINEMGSILDFFDESKEIPCLTLQKLKIAIPMLEFVNYRNAMVALRDSLVEASNEWAEKHGHLSENVLDKVYNSLPQNIKESFKRL